MSIRYPLTTVLDYNDAGNVGAGSVLGGVARTFTLPQDVDNVVVKFSASVAGGGVSAVFQTSDNGGSTWYDVARTSVVSNTAGSVLAEWLSIPTIGVGFNPTRPVTGSVLTTIGSSAASTLGSAQFSGLPIMGVVNRIFLRYAAGVSLNDLSRVEVKANQQSATA